MASVPRNLWLPSLRRRQELLSSALACVQNVLRHCMQTKSDCMLLRSYVVSWVLALGSFPIKRQLCFDFPRSKTCTSPLTWVLYVRQDAPEVATVMRTIKLTLKQKNSLPSDVVEKEKNKSSILLCTRLAHGHCFKYYSSWQECCLSHTKQVLESYLFFYFLTFFHQRSCHAVWWKNFSSSQEIKV